MIMSSVKLGGSVRNVPRNALKFIKLALRRQFSKQQKIDALLVAELMRLLGVVHNALDIVAAVNEPSRNGNFVSFLVNLVSYDISYPRETDENASTVSVAETAFDIVLRIQRRVYRIIMFCKIRQFVEKTVFFQFFFCHT